MLVVLHGKAAGDPGVRAAAAAIQGASAGALGVSVRPTYAAGDAREIVRAELAAASVGARPPVSVVVSGGGDGTLCEVMAALLEHQQRDKSDGGGGGGEGGGGKKPNPSSSPGQQETTPSVALLLLGTANDLGSACGVSADPVAALRLAADPGRARAVDVAFCNGRPFANVATAGPISAVSSAGMSEALKRLLGPLSVPAAGAWTLLSPAGRHALRPQPVTLVFPTARGVPEPPLPPGLRSEAGGGATGPSLSASSSAAARSPARSAVAAAAAAAVAAAASWAAAAGAAAEATAAEGGGGDGGGGGDSASSSKKKEEEQQQQQQEQQQQQQQQQEQQQQKEAGVVVMPAPHGAAGAAVAGGKVMAVRGALVALAVGQSRQMGRFVNVCPAALLDDGLLDATVLFAPSIGEAAADLARDAVAAVAGAAAGFGGGGGAEGGGEGAEGGAKQEAAAQAPMPLAGLCTLRVPWLHVYLEAVAGAGIPGAASDAATAAGAGAAAPASAPPPAAAAAAGAVEQAPLLLQANLDGEPLVRARALRFSLAPRAVRMHLPDERLLVEGVPAAAAAAVEGGGGGGSLGEQEREELEAAARAVAIDFAGSSEQRGGRRSRAAAARLTRRLSAPLALLRGGGRRGAAPSRAHLLRALLRAQQPPGRLARALPVLLARLRVAAEALALVLLGAVLAALVLGRGG